MREHIFTEYCLEPVRYICVYISCILKSYKRFSSKHHHECRNQYFSCCFFRRQLYYCLLFNHVYWRAMNLTYSVHLLWFWMLMLQKQDERQRNMREKTRRLHIGFCMVFHLFVAKHSRKFHVHIFLVHIDTPKFALFCIFFCFEFCCIRASNNTNISSAQNNNKNGKPELKIKM